MAAVHDRMPVILAPNDAKERLFQRDGPALVERLLRAAPADYLVATPVSTRVHSVRNDDPACFAEGNTERAAHLPRSSEGSRQCSTSG